MCHHAGWLANADEIIEKAACRSDSKSNVCTVKPSGQVGSGALSIVACMMATWLVRANPMERTSEVSSSSSLGTSIEMAAAGESSGRPRSSRRPASSRYRACASRFGSGGLAR